MYHLNLQHLLYFREIAVSGSMVNASKKLRISPPALSSQLKVFEENLGQLLFERKGRHLELTEFGKEILRFAHQISHTGKELSAFVNTVGGIKKSKFLFGLGAELPKTLTVECSQIILENFDCELSIIESPNEELRRKLNNHEIPIFFTNRKIYEKNDDILCVMFRQAPLHLYGSKKFLKCRKNFPQSIDGEDFILPTVHSDLRQSIDAWFYKKNLNYKVKAEVQDSASKKELATIGLGLVPISSTGAQKLVKEKKLYFIGVLDGLTEDYYYTMKRKKVGSDPICEYLTQKLLSI